MNNDHENFSRKLRILAEVWNNLIPAKMREQLTLAYIDHLKSMIKKERNRFKYRRRFYSSDRTLEMVIPIQQQITNDGYARRRCHKAAIDRKKGKWT